MDEDDPEKRIADLERQLSEMRAAPAPKPANAWQQPPPPPPGDWGNWSPSPAPFPSSFTQSPFTSSSFGPTYRRRRTNPVVWISLALPIVGLLIAGVVVWTTMSKGSFASSFLSSAPQLHTPDGLNAMFAAERSEFGDTKGFELVVYPDYAVLDRADPQDSRRKKSYTYRGGQWSDWTNGSVSDHDTETDLSRFDVPAVLATLQGAAKSFDFTNPEAPYLIIQGGGVGSPDLSVYVSDHGLSGHMEVNPDGSVKKTYPPS